MIPTRGSTAQASAPMQVANTMPGHAIDQNRYKLMWLNVAVTIAGRKPSTTVTAAHQNRFCALRLIGITISFRVAAGARDLPAGDTASGEPLFGFGRVSRTRTN